MPSSRSRLLCVVFLPAALGAQPRPARPAPIAVTIPTPPPPRPPRMEFREPRWTGGYRGVYGGWNEYPVIVERLVPTAPQVVPVYIPVPAAPRRERAPSPPPVPYDPTKARLLTIGGGADGGAGVMRIARLGTDSVRLTWLGNIRPVREARLFVAAATHAPLASTIVTAERPSATLRLSADVAFVGLTTIFADGSVATALVPVHELPEYAPDQRPGR